VCGRRRELDPLVGREQDDAVRVLFGRLLEAGDRRPQASPDLRCAPQPRQVRLEGVEDEQIPRREVAFAAIEAETLRMPIRRGIATSRVSVTPSGSSTRR
jgi:hypothetical protein